MKTGLFYPVNCTQKGLEKKILKAYSLNINFIV